MNITRTSVLTKVTRTRFIPVNPEDMLMWKKYNISIQEAMPYLSTEDREFILSGITTGEWKEAFSELELA